jgi:hypothetical protein
LPAPRGGRPVGGGQLSSPPPPPRPPRAPTPRAQDILVVDDQVRIADDSGEQTIDLAARGEVRPLIESMLWIFIGDLESLERTYHVEYAVTPAEASADGAGRWRVNLVPRSEPLSQLVSALRVSGTGGVADTLELLEKSGDRTVTRILDANPMREFDSAERLALFGARTR